MVHVFQKFKVFIIIRLLTDMQIIRYADRRTKNLIKIELKHWITVQQMSCGAQPSPPVTLCSSLLTLCVFNVHDVCELSDCVLFGLMWGWVIISLWSWPLTSTSYGTKLEEGRLLVVTQLCLQVHDFTFASRHLMWGDFPFWVSWRDTVRERWKEGGVGGLRNPLFNQLREIGVGFSIRHSVMFSW